jgi:hypothetical protein
VGLTRAFRDLPMGVYVTCQSEKVRDDATGHMLYGVSMPGSKLGTKVPHLFDYVFALRVFQAEGEDVKRAFQTGSDMQYACKDRSGVLDMHEPVDVAHIVRKVSENSKADSGPEKKEAKNGKA